MLYSSRMCLTSVLYISSFTKYYIIHEKNLRVSAVVDMQDIETRDGEIQNFR